MWHTVPPNCHFYVEMMMIIIIMINQWIWEHPIFRQTQQGLDCKGHVKPKIDGVAAASKVVIIESSWVLGAEGCIQLGIILLIAHPPQCEYIIIYYPPTSSPRCVVTDFFPLNARLLVRSQSHIVAEHPSA